MKKMLQKSTSAASCTEKKSEKLLLQKMGVSKKEFHEIYFRYGVDASTILELMQLSKYQFVYSGKVAGRCEPCLMISKMNAVNF